MHRAGDGDIEDHRPGRASNVSPDEHDAIARREGKQPVDDPIERHDLECGRKRHREQRRPWPGAHRGDVAQVDRKRTMADRIRRHESPIEMHAFDLGIRGQYFEGAAHGLNCRGIVSGADNDPGRRGHALSDARDERVLPAIDYCLRIQNEGAKSPALPCGEVE